MKTMKMIAAILAFGLISGSIASAQSQEVDKAKQVYEQAKKALALKDWKTAIEAFKKIEAEYGKSGYYGES